MFRSLSRTAVVAVVAFTLVLACVPAAQASPFSGPSLDTRSGWFDMALSWLSGILFGEEAATPTSTFDNAVTGDGPFLTGGGGDSVQSGSCINPDGRPRPCDL